MDQKIVSVAVFKEFLRLKKKSFGKKLIKLFLKHVLLGQWEIARTFVWIICTELSNEDKKYLSRAIFDIACNPNWQSYGSASVETPEQLSWLALLLYENILHMDNQVSDVNELRHDIEFRLLLVKECCELPDDVFHGIYQYYQMINGSTESNCALLRSSKDDVLPDIFNFLMITLQQKPDVGYCLIYFLTHQNSNSLLSNDAEVFQEFFLNSINKCLINFDFLTSSHIDVLIDKSCINNVADRILLLLSFYDPLPNCHRNKIRHIFHRLIQLSKMCPPSFSREKILEGLVGRKNGYLTDEFFSVLESYELSERNIDLSPNMSEEQMLSVRLLIGDQRERCWQRFFAFCLRQGRHFFDLIMEACISLVKAGHFDTLGMLLSAPELHRLRPLVLLMSWTSCMTFDGFHRLLCTLRLNDISSIHPTFAVMYEKLAHQQTFIKWCFEHTRSLSTSVSNAGCYIMRNPSPHSLLYLLHHSTPLELIDSQQVLHILQNIDGCGCGIDNQFCQRLDFSHDKNHELSGSMLVEQQRDMCIYRSYRAVKNVMDAIVSCYENTSQHFLNIVGVQDGSMDYFTRAISTDASGINKLPNVCMQNSDFLHSCVRDGEINEGKLGMNANLSDIRFRDLYERFVYCRIMDAKEHLQHVYPLVYRVEILENIFSLLFCQHTVLSTAVCANNESDDVAKQELSTGGFKFDSDSLIDNACHCPKGTVSVDFSTHCPNSSLVQEDSSLSHDRNVHAYDHQAKLDSIACGKIHQSYTLAGFMCNDYVVRDILAMLKDALSTLTNVEHHRYWQSEGCKCSSKQASFPHSVRSCHLSTPGAFHAEGNCFAGLSSDSYYSPGHKTDMVLSHQLECLLSSAIQSSISAHEFEHRLAVLRQYVHEAQWRFQLVADKRIPRQPGHVQRHLNLTCNDNENMGSLNSDLFYSDTMKNAKFGNCNEQSLVKSSLTHGQYPSKIISHMLSAPISLLCTCLNNSCHKEATQVIKLLNLDSGMQEVSEAGFVSAFNVTANTILSMVECSSNHSHRHLTPTAQHVCDISNIDVGACAASTSIGQLIEDLLKHASLPSLPKPSWTNYEHCTSYYRDVFAFSPLAAVCLDLVCTVCTTWEQCHDVFSLMKDKALLGNESHQTMNVSEDRCRYESDFSRRVGQENDGNIVGMLSNDTPDNHVSLDTFNVCGFRQFVQQLDHMLHMGHGILGISSKVLRQEQFDSSDVFLSTDFTNPSWIPHRQQFVAEKPVLMSLMERLCTIGPRFEWSDTQWYEQTLREVQHCFDTACHYVCPHGAQQGSPEFLFLDDSHFARTQSSTYSPPLPSSPTVSNLYSGSRSFWSFSRDSFLGDVGGSIVHHHMKHLIVTMERLIPHSGISSLLIHKHTGGTMKNYLRTTYQYVKVLAKLLVECDSVTTENRVLMKNYFNVLNESPADILGRLMFSKSIPPFRLEKLALHLGIDLVHFIIRSCCPHIPSRNLFSPTHSAIPDMKSIGPRCIYNWGHCSTGNETNPDLLVRNILKDVLFTMQDNAMQYGGKQVFSVQSGQQMLKLDHYASMVSRLCALQKVDLNLLDSDQKRICFFANLLNLMTIHYNLHCILHGTDVSSAQHGQSFTDFVDCSGEHFISLVDMNMAEKVKLLGSFCYRLGQLGTLSLFDLKYMMLLHGQMLSSRWMSLLQSSRQKVSPPDDAMCVFMPPVEPRLLFVISDGCTSSPPVQVLEPSMLEAQLSSAVKNYVLHTVVLHPESRTVVLPLLLMSFTFGMVEEQMGNEFFDKIFHFVSVNLPPTQAEKLHAITQCQAVDGASTPVMAPVVCVSDFCSEFSYCFQMVDVAVVTAEQNADPVNSYDQVQQRLQSFDSILPGRRFFVQSECRQHNHIENNSECFGKSIPVPHLNHAQLSPVMLDYVRESSDLLATLLTLVYTDWSEESSASFEENVMSDDMEMRSRSSSDVSIVDIRSYCYRRLVDDFPVLQRHMLVYAIPLAAADNMEISFEIEPLLKFVTNNADQDIKANLFSLHDSSQFLTLLDKLALKLLANRHWKALLDIIRTIPDVVIVNKPGIQLLHDFTIVLWAKQSNDESLLPYMGKMYCHDLQARTVIAIADDVSLDWAMRLLDICLAQPLLVPELRSVVEAKRRRLCLYDKIVSGILGFQSKMSEQQSQLSPSCHRLPVCGSITLRKEMLLKYSDWHHLSRQSVKNPLETMDVLFQAVDIALVREWALLHQLSEDLVKEVDTRCILSLCYDETKTVQIFQEMETVKLRDPLQCLQMCQMLLQQMTNCHFVVFLIQYVLQNLSSLLDCGEIQQLKLTSIGAKALICMPENMRRHYSHLIAQPHLILEQLLMNAKTELTAQIFEKTHEEFSKVDNCERSMNVDQFNRLLAKYAQHALEVSVVQASGTSGAEASIKTSSRRTSMLSMSSSALGLGAADRSNLTATTEAGTFVLPPAPPLPSQWVPDRAVVFCMVCRTQRFSMFNRRHHCRRCGRVVCTSCSHNLSPVCGAPARTCDDCFQQISAVRNQFGVYGAHLMECMSKNDSSSSSLSGVYRSSYRSQGQQGKSHSLVVFDHEHVWKLDVDEETNNRVRLDFFYEQAPSVSLCMSMLQLHSHRQSSGRLILDMCDKLSSILQPIHPGMPNTEVDYGLIISIIRKLLYYAKVILRQIDDCEMTSKCDAYRTRVDLLNSLIMANYPNLPTLQQLSGLDTARHLVDRLIKDQRLSLALDVCTKCGIEASGVWLAWGRTCLHSADFIGARNKFSHCLKVPKDKNQTKSSSHLLTEILHLLQTLPAFLLLDMQILTLSTAKTSTHLSASVLDEPTLDQVVMNECEFYLKIYGTFCDHIKFLVTSGCWNKALRFVLHHRCSTEVFVETVLQSALLQGEMSHMVEQIQMLDPSLTKWMPYLTQSCRFLLRNRQFHVLYRVQLLMKDFIRASMTCINHFYRHNATSYNELGNRLHHLFTAQEHLYAYLDPMKWGSVSRPSSRIEVSSGPKDVGQSSCNAQLYMSKLDIQKQLHSISLQIEVTQYLEPYFTGPVVKAITDDCSKGVDCLPTMFGTDVDRKYLVKMVVMCGGKIEASLDIALRIIHECQLDTVSVVKSVVCEQLHRSHFSAITSLLKIIDEKHVLSDADWDDVICMALMEITSKNMEMRDEKEMLLKMIRLESYKVNSLIMVGKLRSAYLIAAKRKCSDDIARIMAASELMGQTAVHNICAKWLQQSKGK